MVEMGQTASALDCTQQPNDGGRRLRPRRPPGTLTQAAASVERQAILTRTVELDVIPRLLRAHGLGKPVPKAPAVSATDTALLVELSLAPDEAATTGFVMSLQDQGFDTEALYLNLLAPAAARLGTMWDEDLCDFTEVTIGLNRLHRAMRDLGGSLIGSRFLQGAGRQAGKRALIMPLPGEQHTFGISMVLEFFRRAGWSAWSGAVDDSGELLTMVRSDWVDVVGFSLACDERLETARTEIRAVRLASRNPAVAVMVGGPAFVANPDLAAAIGADGTASDGMQAVRQAQALVDRQVERR